MKAGVSISPILALFNIALFDIALFDIALFVFDLLIECINE